MRTRFDSLADRLLEKVAPKATASAASCWQPECWPNDICDGKKGRLMKVNPCTGGNQFVRCGCRI
ncbi:hypothetical protein [Embleya scabrispora]|uniref:hypothetical protein n=1 Tax=Embleya scabrispora TaxID=159449 RepID=UPI00035E4035|nr:hypothetical protein [Embleya scabrispora]MYS86155.1 hypothetical protein [Streptomyces sp. SID5474]